MPNACCLSFFLHLPAQAPRSDGGLDTDIFESSIRMMVCFHHKPQFVSTRQRAKVMRHMNAKLAERHFSAIFAVLAGRVARISRA
jgi:hypothetical protein